MNNPQKILLSIIVPVYNEESVLNEFHDRLLKAIESHVSDFEILYVNDGSTDNSLNELTALEKNDFRIHILDLSRNFGKEAAMTAGLDYSKGDIVVVIDADLQDPPELIPAMIEQWRQGSDVVYAKRTKRHGEGPMKRLTAYLFYKIINRLSSCNIPEQVGDFRLLSRQAVDALKQLRERKRFMKGLFTWIGYTQSAIEYHRDPRFSGKSKWNYWQLCNFALDGITSFSQTPLRLAAYTGVFTAISAFLFAFFIILKTLIYGDPVPGYPSLIVIILFFSGIQLLAIGVLGEYLGHMFIETKQRPLYLLKQRISAEKNVRIK
jgi:polyisoprenyl-phosphate glycosyltransferase